MKTLKSTQQNPRYYAVINSDGNVQGVVLADDKFEDRFLSSISQSYDAENVSIEDGFEVGQFDYEFSVSVIIEFEDEEPYKESFEFQMVEIY